MEKNKANYQKDNLVGKIEAYNQGAPMKLMYSFLANCFVSRALIWTLFLRELKNRFAGTYGGVFWFFGQHLLSMVIYLFVFAVGFKTPPAAGVPYSIILITGYIPWVLFAEAIHSSTISITQNPYLVTRTVFPVQVLVVVSFMIGVITHAVLLAILLVILACSGIAPSLWSLQIVYYLFGLTLLSLGLGWCFAALNVICRDIAHVVSIVLNVWFWATPVVWYTALIPDNYLWVLRINPLFYVVEGYRKALLFHTSFWTDGTGLVYFWMVCGAVFFLGIKAFITLQPEFAEVL
jgi:teichoic acid transport system permease protein